MKHVVLYARHLYQPFWNIKIRRVRSAGRAREGQNMAHLGHINGPCVPMHLKSNLQLIFNVTKNGCLAPYYWNHGKHSPSRWWDDYLSTAGNEKLGPPREKWDPSRTFPFTERNRWEANIARNETWIATNCTRIDIGDIYVIKPMQNKRNNGLHFWALLFFTLAFSANACFIFLSELNLLEASAQKHLK